MFEQPDTPLTSTRQDPPKLIIDKLREYADIAEAGDKPNWAKTMREAVEVIKIFESDEYIARHFGCSVDELHVCHECDGFGVRP